MSSGNPESGLEEITKPQHATLGISVGEQRPGSASGRLSEGSKTSSISIDSDDSATSEDVAIREGITDGAILSEVRSSLQTISNGVEELATTVQDLFGLSDPESSASSDYNQNSQGRRDFSWRKFKSRARQRRLSRRRKPKGVPRRWRAIESESDDEDPAEPEHVIPSIRYCNFEQFKLRPLSDDYKLYCVDVLVADGSLSKEITDFENTIQKLVSGNTPSWKPDYASNEEEELSIQDAGKRWIRWIRINSPAVMQMLRHLRPTIKGLRGRPPVFHRPFQLLVSLHHEIKEQLANLKGLMSLGSHRGMDRTAPSSNTTESHECDNLMEKLGNKTNALSDLECFVNFMESRIMLDALRYRAPSSHLPQTIRYEDLWYLYKPGDLVYVPRDASGRDRFRSTTFSQQILRVIQTAVTEQSTPPPLGLSNDMPWSVLCHFIEHDGTSYAPVHVRFPPFVEFLGEKKVTELPIYPISYLEDEQVMAEAQFDGATYVSLIERRFGFYSGWTQTVTPLGIQLTENSRGAKLVSPEHVESDILVDFQETFNAIPDWRPVFYPGVDGNWGFVSRRSGLVKSKQPLLEWDDTGRTRHNQFDRDFMGDTTEQTEAQKLLVEDSLGQFRKSTRKAPAGKFLALLPRRFFGYAVLERKFVQLNTRFVRSADLEAIDKAFEKLEINRSYKKLILALVKSHFDKIETERKTNVEIETQDLIRGKGKGVVILLHGVPGVGKTATAEAVALKWKKPLFPITCGDLGYTAEALEKSLNEIFRLAHHWGCILLLDEADVFITQRERHDLKRNALVSGKCRKRCSGFDLETID